MNQPIATLLLLASLSADPGSEERMLEIACGQGVAEGWSRSQALQELGAEGAELVGVYLAWPQLLDLECEPDQRWSPGEMLREAVGSLAPDVRRRGLKAALTGDPDLPQRYAAFELLGEFGRSSDLELYLAFAGGIPEEVQPMSQVRRSFESGLTALVQRYPALGTELGDGTKDCPPGLRSSLPRVAREALGGRAAPALKRMARGDSALELAVLEELARFDSQALALCRAPLTELARQALEAIDATPRRLAVSALGHMLDGGSAPALLGLLLDPDERVRRKARWALTRIAGKDHGADIANWNSWWRGEQEWRTKQLPDLLDQLEDERIEPVIAALEVLGRRTAHRHELAAQVAGSLSRGAAVGAAAARALERLGSVDAVGALVAALDHPDLAVRQASHRALRRITGAEIGLDAGAWAAWLAS